MLAHGVFDILHVGHKRHLDIGKRHGDVLIVTLTTDKFVNKGPDRPVFAEKLRAEMVAGLESVDYVGISPNPGAEHVIEAVSPDFYLKGSEYSDEEDDVTGRIKTERLTVEKFGGEVLYTEDITFSSSNLSNRVLQLYPEDARPSQGSADAHHRGRPHQGGRRRPEHALPHHRRYDPRRIHLRRTARKAGQGEYHRDQYRDRERSSVAARSRRPILRPSCAAASIS